MKTSDLAEEHVLLGSIIIGAVGLSPYVLLSP
jgi:hypothetical protein